MWKLEERDYRKRVLGPACEAFKTGGAIPDRFARYDLPLDVSDEADIRKALETVELLWNRIKNESKYVKLLPLLLAEAERKECKRILLDEQARAKERGVVEGERHALLEAKFEALDASLAVVAGKGSITPQEKADLLKRYQAAGLTEKEITDRIRVPVREAAARAPLVEGLPKRVRDEIRANLNAFKQGTLYAFLGMREHPRPSKDEIRRKYDEVSEEWRRKPNDHLKTGANQLLAHVKLHLLDGDPAQYDAALRWEVCEMLRPDVEFAAVDGQVSRSEFDSLLKRAIEMGIPETEATDIIVAMATDLGAGVEFSAAGADGMRCGHCFAVLAKAPGGEKCPVCGLPLWTKCPRCGVACPSAARACQACAFVLSDIRRVERDVYLGQKALAEGRLSDAAEYTSEAVRLWGTGGDAGALSEAIATRQRELEAMRLQFDDELGKGRLSAADQTLRRIEAAGVEIVFADRTTPADLRRALAAVQASLSAMLDKAREHDSAGRTREAVLAFEAALGIAADSPEAVAGLRRHVPEPSPAVRAECVGGEVVVSWEASPAVGTLTYVLMARAGAPATAPNGNRAVCRVQALNHRDEGAPRGVPFYYALFVDRGGAMSPPATAGPLLLMPEVRGAALEVGDRRIGVTWELPLPNARPRVFRRTGVAPAAPGDGQEIAGAGSHGFTDREVENEALYYYRISVEYQDALGRAVLSPGVVVTGRPTTPPAAVQALQVARQADGLHLTWAPPAAGEVAIIRTATAPAAAPGTLLPTSRLAGLGTRLASSGPGAAVDGHAAAGVVYYLPVTVKGDLAVIGTARRFVAIPDVAHLRGQDFGHYLQLQWQWPDDSPFAMVTWRKDRPPTDVDDAGAERRKVTRGEYDREGGVRIESPAATPHHFVVHAARVVGTEAVFAPGIEAGARLVLRAVPQIAVSYEVRGSWLGKLNVTFSSAAPIAELPEVVVIGCRGTVQPRRIEDGEILATFERLRLAPADSAGGLVSLARVRRPVYLRAFFRDREAYTRFKLVDPSPAQLQLR